MLHRKRHRGLIRGNWNKHFHRHACGEGENFSTLRAWAVHTFTLSFENHLFRHGRVIPVYLINYAGLLKNISAQVKSKRIILLVHEPGVTGLTQWPFSSPQWRSAHGQCSRPEADAVWHAGAQKTWSKQLCTVWRRFNPCSPGSKNLRFQMFNMRFTCLFIYLF